MQLNNDELGYYATLNLPLGGPRPGAPLGGGPVSVQGKGVVRTKKAAQCTGR